MSRASQVYCRGSGWGRRSFDHRGQCQRGRDVYPPGDYGFDAVTNRLAQGRRRIEIREMASGRFSPMLISRKSGNPFPLLMPDGCPSSETGGNWKPRLALLSVPPTHPFSLWHRTIEAPYVPVDTDHPAASGNMGALSFEQMVFKEADMIAQTPGQVIQSLRLALANNAAARLVPEDQKLPSGLSVERRMPQIRQPVLCACSRMFGKVFACLLHS